MQTDAEGRGVINVLAADRLYNSPKLYSTFLLWLLAELFENCPWTWSCSSGAYSCEAIRERGGRTARP
jgi:hypothetical protein